MLLVVEDSFTLSSQNPTLAEKLARTKTWARMLVDTIPENRLQESFDYAFKLHDSPFPISAYEIKTAYAQILIEEAAAKAEIIAELKNRPENRVANCSQKQYHLDGNGTVKVVNPFNFNDEIELPCRECRSEAYYDQRERFIHKHGRIEPLEVLNNFVNFQDFKSKKL